MSSLLLVFDPADDLIPVKDQSAVGREAEVRKPSGNEGLSYTPRRTADHAGDFGDIERYAERRKWPDLGGRSRQERPVFA